MPESGGRAPEPTTAACVSSGLQKQAQPWQLVLPSRSYLPCLPVKRQVPLQPAEMPQLTTGHAKAPAARRARAPGEQDVVRVVKVEPGAEDGEGLHALARRRLERVARHAGRRAGRARLRAVAVVHVKVQQRHAPHACAPRALSAHPAPRGLHAVVHSQASAEHARHAGPACRVRIQQASAGFAPAAFTFPRMYYPPGWSGPLAPSRRRPCEGRWVGARPPRGMWTPRTPRRWPGCSAGRSPGCRAGRSRRSRCRPGPRGAPAAAPRRTRCAPGARAPARSPTVYRL